MCSEDMASALEVSPNLGMDSSNGRRDRYRLEAAEDVFHECLPARASGARRSMDAVKQLADGDHADPALFIAHESFEHRGIL